MPVARREPTAPQSNGARRIRSTLSKDSDLPPVSRYAAGFAGSAEISWSAYTWLCGTRLLAALMMPNAITIIPSRAIAGLCAHHRKAGGHPPLRDSRSRLQGQRSRRVPESSDQGPKRNVKLSSCPERREVCGRTSIDAGFLDNFQSVRKPLGGHWKSQRRLGGPGGRNARPPGLRARGARQKPHVPGFSSSILAESP
jgi:hypothetical protein